MQVKKQVSEQDALFRLAAKCATAEYCIADMRRKMSRWELPEGAEERIIQKLLEGHYIDECRYAHSYVRDKFHHNHWGWIKIERELQMKHISQEFIEEAREEINSDDNLAKLRKMIETKRKTTKGKNDYEINGKLFRFALSRGFSYEDINQVLHTDFDEES